MIYTYVLMEFFNRIDQPDLSQILWYLLIFQACMIPFQIIGLIAKDRR